MLHLALALELNENSGCWIAYRNCWSNDLVDVLYGLADTFAHPATGNEAESTKQINA